MPVFLLYVLYIFIGGFAGILGGLLGIGGGIITVPCLFFLFQHLMPEQPFIMHMAIATSLAAMLLNTIAAAWAHHRHNHVLWDLVRKFTPGLILGSIVGALVANFLPSSALEVIFGIFLCLLALYFYRQKAIGASHHNLPSNLTLSGCGCGIGMISNLLGIGGGSFTVPLLTSFQVKDKLAIGTSSALTSVTIFCGTLSYYLIGLKDLPREPLGLINPKAFILIGTAAALSAPLGVKLVTMIDPQKVRKIFALVLALTGISLFI